MSAPQAESAPKKNNQLMIAAGDAKGQFDPEAPSQWQWVYDNGTPIERGMAWVKSKTTHMSRSAFCVDEHGNALRAAHMAADLGWTEHTAKNVLTKLAKQGRVRLKGSRIWYRADVPEGRREGEETSFVQTPFPPYVMEAIGNLSGEKRETWERVKLQFTAWREAVIADALAGVRSTIIEPVENSMFEWLGVDKKRLPKREPKKRDGRLPLQIQLLEEPSFVQSLALDFEQTAKNGLHKPQNGSVQSAQPYRQTQTQTESVCQSRVESPRVGQKEGETTLPAANGTASPHPSKKLPVNGGLHGQVQTLLLKLVTPKLHESPGPALCKLIALELGDTPLERYAEVVRKRFEKPKAADTTGLCLHLARDARVAWAAERDRAAGDAEANERVLARQRAQEQQVARDTLNDPHATEQERQIAREILGAAAKSAKGASA